MIMNYKNKQYFDNFMLKLNPLSIILLKLVGYIILLYDYTSDSAIVIVGGLKLELIKIYVIVKLYY